jgi:hypothetical protein
LPRLLARVRKSDVGDRNARQNVATIIVAAVCFCDGALAVAAGEPRHTSALVGFG